MRTWTNEDGVFIHIGDLVENLEKLQTQDSKRPAAVGLYAVAHALRHVECTALKHAVTTTMRERRFLGLF